MPDEPIVENPPAPTLDPVALGKQIADATAASVKAALDNQPPPQAPVQQQQMPTDALEEILAPYINRGSNKAMLVAQLAADKADFYTHDDPEVLAERWHFKEEIEKRALGLASNGKAMPRDDIFKHLKGEQEEKVSNFRGARRKAREDRVRLEGGDHGGGSMSRDGGIPRLITADTAYELQGSGKLDEALSDKSF